MCGLWKPESDFAFQDRASGKRQSHCRSCQAAYRHAHYIRNRDAYIQLEVARMSGYRDANRALLLAYLLDHPCVDCGEADPVLLDFDHRDPSSKRSEVGRLAGRKQWPQVLAEIEKCDVRCANCHRRRTARQFAWGKLTRSASLIVTTGAQPNPTNQPSEPREIWPSDGATRVCCTCRQAKSVGEFALKNKQRGTRSTKCRACQAAYSRDHYQRNRATYIKRAAARRKRDRETCRQQLFDYLLAHPCVDCGETDPIVLEFDHRDRSLKRGSISRLIGQFTWAVVELEIASCDVRCANCHRQRTAQQFGWAKLQEDSA
jgi:hypothetical protein